MPWTCHWCNKKHPNNVASCTTWSCRVNQVAAANIGVTEGWSQADSRGKAKGNGKKGNGKAKGNSSQNQSGGQFWYCSCCGTRHSPWQKACTHCSKHGEAADHPNGKGQEPPLEKGQLTIHQALNKQVVKEAGRLQGAGSMAVDQGDSEAERKKLQAEIAKLDSFISANAGFADEADVATISRRGRS